jgi:hypothetical protein
VEMRRHRVAKIPVLPFAVLERVQKVQEAATKGLVNSAILGTKYLDHERAAEIMCSCALAELDIRLDHYLSLPEFGLAWGVEIGQVVLMSALSYFPNFTFEARPVSDLPGGVSYLAYEDPRQFFDELSDAISAHVAHRLEQAKKLLPSPSTIIIEPLLSKSQQREALRDSYLAQFPDERIVLRDLSFAVGQRYREWTRWLAGESKDGSTPDLAFRRILESGKRPHEFNKKRRPSNWE